MQRPTENYWQIRLRDLKEALESNNFEVFMAENAGHAKKIVLEEILPKIQVKTVAFGGSVTITESGLYQALKEYKGLEIIDTYDRTVPQEEFLERRRRALLSDLFFSGTNAVTETGQLVNLDMIGNRIGGIVFGPKYVIIVVGRNKVVSDLDEALYRIKNFVAPANAMRLDMNTPCVKTSYCEDCKSPARICNTWTITEKSFPKGRIKIVLMNEAIGL